MQKVEGRCMKCRSSNQQRRDCKGPLKVKTPLFIGNANQDPAENKRRFNKRHLNITKLVSEEDLGNEQRVLY